MERVAKAVGAEIGCPMCGCMAVLRKDKKGRWYIWCPACFVRVLMITDGTLKTYLDRIQKREVILKKDMKEVESV